MSIREKLQNLNKKNLYKLKTPNIFKDNYLQSQSKEWLKRRNDFTDFFNYGFNDATLLLYTQKLNKITDINISKLQKEYATIKEDDKTPWQQLFKSANQFRDDIPLDYGGQGIPLETAILPPQPNGSLHSILFDQVDYFNEQEDMEFVYNCPILKMINENYKQYLNETIGNREISEVFQFEAVFEEQTKYNKSKEIPNILYQMVINSTINNIVVDSVFPKEKKSQKKTKHEKKKTKKEKKIKKEKKKKHKKHRSDSQFDKQEESYVESINVKESQNQQDNVNQNNQFEENHDISVDDQDQLSSPSCQQNEQQQQIIQVKQEEKIEEKIEEGVVDNEFRQTPRGGNNWTRNLIQGILQGNTRQRR